MMEMTYIKCKEVKLIAQVSDVVRIIWESPDVKFLIISNAMFVKGV